MLASPINTYCGMAAIAEMVIPTLDLLIYSSGFKLPLTRICFALVSKSGSRTIVFGNFCSSSPISKVSDDISL